MDSQSPPGTSPGARPLSHWMLYETTCALTESDSLGAAAPRMLGAICTALDWEYGAVWEVDRARRELRCVGTHQPEGDAFDAFAAASRGITFTAGAGLPGRAWSSGQPAWIADIREDGNFPRAASADRVGLRAAFALPIRSGAEVLGVLEFFSREIRPLDDELLETLGT